MRLRHDRMTRGDSRSRGHCRPVDEGTIDLCFYDAAFENLGKSSNTPGNRRKSSAATTSVLRPRMARSPGIPRPRAQRPRMPRSDRTTTVGRLGAAGKAILADRTLVNSRGQPLRCFTPMLHGSYDSNGNSPAQPDVIRALLDDHRS